MSTFTDKLVNKISPDEQIASLYRYSDNISEAEKAIIAEKLGLPISGAAGTAGEEGGTLNDFVDATYNAFSEAHVGRWIRIFVSTGSTNNGFYHIDAFTSASTVKISPALPGADDSMEWQMYEEPSLATDMELMLTQIREMINPSSDWFQNMPRGFDPANTDGSNTKNEKISLKVLADNWYGSHTKIVDILFNDGGAGYAVATSDTGVLLTTALGYADPADRRGLVIQASTANSGSYYDEVALASIIYAKHKVTVVDALTGNEFKDANGNVIYGVLQDGSDHSGSGEGTDVFVKFVSDVAGTPTAYTWTANDPANVLLYVPQRKKRTELNEYDERRILVAGVVGDAELTEDISQIRSALGIADGEEAGDWDWTNTTAAYPLQSDPATAEGAINALNDAIGDRQYTENNYITDGETITDSLDALDLAIASAGVKSKIVERVTVDIARGVSHTIPFASGSDSGVTTYKVDSGYRGLYMDVYVGGAKLVPDSSASLQDGEYEETSNTAVTFRFKVKAGQIIEYIIRDDA